jgi:hypothetical protein
VACPVPSPRPRRRGMPRSGPAARAGQRSAHRVRSHRARGPRGGAASDGSPVDGAWQGQRRKHPRSAAKASGKRKRGGAHPSGNSM